MLHIVTQWYNNNRLKLNDASSYNKNTSKLGIEEWHSCNLETRLLYFSNTYLSGYCLLVVVDNIPVFCSKEVGFQLLLADIPQRREPPKDYPNQVRPFLHEQRDPSSSTRNPLPDRKQEGIDTKIEYGSSQLRQRQKQSHYTCAIPSFFPKQSTK